MTRLSLQPGGLAMDAPILNPYTISSLTDAEAELWNLFHQFSPGLLKTTLPGLDSSSASSPKSVLSEKPTVGGCHEDGACFLKRNGITKPVCWMVSDALKRCHSLPDMLIWLKRIAASPCEPVISAAASEWRMQILKARHSLFLSKTEPSFDAQYPYPTTRKRRRFDRSLSLPSATILSHKRHASSEVTNQPARRSKRFLGMLKFGENNGRRKRVPVDSSFQAHVPEWCGPPSQSDQLDDERWLGTKIWMLDSDGRDLDNWMIGKGRPSLCVCTYPGSVACVRFHVEIARLQLKFDLGSAFSGWGFGEMGEDVSKSWTSEEQQTFDTIMRVNPFSEYMDFLEPALKAFPSKTKRSIVSYYFNVFVLRRMSKLTRFASGLVDSDDDGNDNEVFQVLHSANSQRRKKSA
ncbi:putative ELM2 domain-containing protein [Dioscorea sansibarensis]